MKNNQEIVRIYKIFTLPALKLLIEFSFILSAASANFYFLYHKPPLILIFTAVALFIISSKLNKIYTNIKQPSLDVLIYSLPTSFYIWSFINPQIKQLWDNYSLGNFFKIYQLIAIGFMAILSLSFPMLFPALTLLPVIKMGRRLFKKGKLIFNVFFIFSYCVLLLFVMFVPLSWFFKTDFYFQLSIENILLPLVIFLIGSLPLGWIYKLLPISKRKILENYTLKAVAEKINKIYLELFS